MNEFCLDNKGWRLHGGLQKGDVTRPQAFVCNAFDITPQIHAAKNHNGYKKTYERVKNKRNKSSRDDVKWLLGNFQVRIVDCQNITLIFL